MPLPVPPYEAVIFTTRLRESARQYEETSERILSLARAQPGFLGIDSARGADGLGITVSYWKDASSVQAWREHLEHAAARRRGREEWYRRYDLHVATVHRSSSWTDAGPTDPA